MELPSSDIFKMLGKHTHDWMAEYCKINTALKNYRSYKNHTNDTIVNVFPNKITITHGNNIYNAHGQNSNFFYKIMIDKISTRPYMEKIWEKRFKITITTTEWSRIYLDRIHILPCHKLKQFQYKLINNIIVSKEELFKWKRSHTNKCSLCGEMETVQHIYYYCANSKEIWAKVNNVFGCNILWKHIILGYYCETKNIHTETRHIIFSIILYSIYKIWVKGMNDNVPYTTNNIRKEIHSDLLYWKLIATNCQKIQLIPHIINDLVEKFS